MPALKYDGRVIVIVTSRDTRDEHSLLRTGPGEVMPVGLTTIALGGGDWQYDTDTGAGQQGCAGAYGLNNIGLLIRTWSQVTEIGAGFFRIGSDPGVKCVVPDGVMLPTPGDHVVVTGISSCEKVGDDLRSLVLVRTEDDVIVRAH